MPEKEKDAPPNKTHVGPSYANARMPPFLLSVFYTRRLRLSDLQVRGSQPDGDGWAF